MCEKCFLGLFVDWHFVQPNCIFRNYGALNDHAAKYKYYTAEAGEKTPVSGSLL
jgi:hypothetical protein